MALTFVSAILVVALIMTFYLVCVTFRHCQSDKRYYFVLSLFAVFASILGYLMEITATSDGAALAGVKIHNIGNLFLPSTYLLFVIDYCNINIKRVWFNIVRAVILSLSSFFSVMFWTSDRHTLVFSTHFFDAGMPFRGLQSTIGPLFLFAYIHAIICVIAGCAILFSRMFKWRKQHRKILFLMLLSAIGPLAAEVMFMFVTIVINPESHMVNLMPFVLIITDCLFYYTVVRHSLFDFVPVAYSAVFDSIDHAFIILDPELACASVNAAGLKIFPEITECRDGVPVTTLRNWPLELHDFTLIEFRTDIRFTVEYRSDIRYFSASADELREHGALLGYTILIKDVTNQQELLAQLEFAAYTDGLTGVYNRRHFIELAEKCYEKSQRQGAPCFAMIFDLDFFKQVNDTYGHAAGDEVLRTVAARVRDTVRTYDLFARYGGEEFAIMLEGEPDTDTVVAKTLAERIRLNVAKTPCHWDGIEIPVSISIGVASAEDTATLDELLRHADEAMYGAKTAGRNRVVIYNDQKQMEMEFPV